MMVAVPINLIGLDERGVAYISGTRMKVRHIALEKTVSGRTAEQIQEQYPHLSLAQIYAALSYYHAHKEEIDAEIAQADRQTETLLSEVGTPVDMAELRTMSASMRRGINSHKNE